ncbi:histidine kinase [Dermatophilus congolensis]|uniref:histidine kinase n=1 Tax=Dermatophilus congolensis TaxID=1863 RepID=UPI001AAF22CD|nr:histidine kinase [Dermatophilus congolensis]MBO3143424.1 histidine kinase [Dermatophilus congolensis]MBO3152414.1 histidine kinase [Dermatophilus congolensis]MBO3160575.1 histidine kinase [Dermatophilus congolensis]MBO3163701.1 histidine kinase [Dermatophilus congolensis]MBO3177247.1 histidine kinase [Dermatophilus congolensis]
MSDNFIDDVEDLMANLSSVSPRASFSQERSRLIVATDWSRASIPLTILRAYAAIAMGGEIDLVFAVPYQPTEADVSCIGVLAEGVGMESIPETVQLSSFDEVLTREYDTAVVPNGDSDQELAQVGGMVTRMYILSSAGGKESVVNPGDLEALRLRLSEFRG